MEENKQMEYEEIDLMDYVKVIFKRKKLIAGIFVVAVVTAGAISFSLPKVYKTDMTLGVGKIEDPEAKTDAERIILIEDPAQVKQKIDNDVYGVSIREKLSVSENEYPKIKTENPKDTNLVTVKIESDKTQRARDILKELSNLIIAEHRERIKSRIDLIDKNVKTVGEKIKLTQENIKSTENKIAPMDSDIGRLENKIKHANEEKVNLESKVDSLQKILPYQQDPGTQFALFDAKEKLAGKKQEIENLYMEINSLKKQKDDLQIEINKLKADIEGFNSEVDSFSELKNSIKETREIKPVIVSEKQVSPRPVLNVGIAGVLGLFIGIFVAFGKEWWEKNRNRI